MADKVCTACGAAKPLDQFHRQASSRDGRSSACAACQCARTRVWRAANVTREQHAAQERAWRKANPEKYAARKLRMRLAKYSLTMDQYMDLLMKQEGRCAACGSDDPGHTYGQFGIDHDHSCCPGRWSCGDCIRGLLCHGCNAALGNIGDNIVRLEKLLAYMRRSELLEHDSA